MLDKGNGELRAMTAAAPVRRTIEELAEDARAHRLALENFSARPLISARELRHIWETRVRPFWRLNLGAYQALARRLVELSENYLAIEVATEGMEFFGDDPRLILSRALASARCGAIAQTHAILLEKQAALAGTSEYLSLLGRTRKDLWKVSGEPRELEESFRSYHEDYLLEKKRAPQRAAFPGANAASMALLLGQIDRAFQLAQEVLALLDQEPQRDYWKEVTRAECELVLGQLEAARAHYASAVVFSPQPYANLMTTRAQCRLLLPIAGLEARAFDDCFSIPRVACFSGHRLDEGDRAQPRFPASSADSVKARIRAAVENLGIGFGYSSAANGADILFLEVMQELGRETYITLPMAEPDFIARSVRHDSSPEWIARFENVLDRATAVTIAETSLPPSGIVFDYGNQLCFGAAAQKARELDTELIVLAVWDGRAGEARGGTADVVQMASAAGARIEVITPDGAPTPLAFGISAPALPAASEEAIVHALAFCVREENEAEADEKVAFVLRNQRLLATEVHGRWFHLFFARAEDAPDTALALLDQVAPHLQHSLGLHSLPVRQRIHPVSGALTFSASLVEKAVRLASLEPTGQIYTSVGFAALAEKNGRTDFRCEFLGHRPLVAGKKAEPVFRLVVASGRVST